MLLLLQQANAAAGVSSGSLIRPGEDFVWWRYRPSHMPGPLGLSLGTGNECIGQKGQAIEIVRAGGDMHACMHGLGWLRIQVLTLSWNSGLGRSHSTWGHGA